MTTPTLIHLTLEDFSLQYPLVDNSAARMGAWQIDGKARLFGAYGGDLAFVQRQDERHVWTLVDDGDEQYLVSGYRMASRIGHLVSTQPWPEGVMTVVTVRSESD